MYSVFLAFTLQPHTQLPQSLQGCCSVRGDGPAPFHLLLEIRMGSLSHHRRVTINAHSNLPCFSIPCKSQAPPSPSSHVSMELMAAIDLFVYMAPALRWPGAHPKASQLSSKSRKLRSINRNWLRCAPE